MRMVKKLDHFMSSLLPPVTALRRPASVRLVSALWQQDIHRFVCVQQHTGYNGCVWGGEGVFLRGIRAHVLTYVHATFFDMCCRCRRYVYTGSLYLCTEMHVHTYVLTGNCTLHT